MMRIRDRIEFKNKNALVTFKPNQSIRDAVEIMSEKNIGSVLIVDDNQSPVGILTERDLMRRVLNNGLDIHLTKLEDVMTKHIKIANQDDNALEWMRQMSNERFRHLPVIDDEGKAIAVLSQGDFMSYTWPQLMMNLKEGAKMTVVTNQQLFVIIGSILLYSLGLSLILGA